MDHSLLNFAVEELRCYEMTEDARCLKSAKIWVFSVAVIITIFLLQV